MLVPVRQSILWTVVASFLAGNFLLAAALWRSGTNGVVCWVASGVLVAEPMLLAAWLGLSLQPVARRLRFSVGLSAVAATAYSAGILPSDARMNAGVYILFLVCGIGATLLGGGFFRAHRFLIGVLTAADETAADATVHNEAVAEQSVADRPADARAAAEDDADDAVADARGSSFLAEAQSVASVSGELQFGVGYMIAMTSGIAMMISVLRWLATNSHGPKWSTIFLFGWTFFVYSLLAALVVLAGVLATGRPRLRAMLAVAYTLAAPLAAVPIINIWGVTLTSREHFLNLYAFALGLSMTLAVVAWLIRCQGYRLRRGWL